MEFWDKKLGLGIKLRRKEMNIRQVDLAERLHVESTTISRWETGSGSPDISILPNLAYELGTTVDDLLGNKKRNKEDEIKKEKVNIIKILSSLLKLLIILMIVFIFILEYYFNTSIFSISYVKITIFYKYLFFIIANGICVILIFFNKLKRLLITKIYVYKYKHKYPIGYKFEIKESYLNFLNIIIFLFTLLFDTLLILG